MDFDLNTAAIFVKIVETGSFSGAARALKMPKTTVSARFAALEAALGIHLIQRTTRRLFVTEAGRQFLEHCITAVDALEAGHAELQALGGVPRGVLRLITPVGIGHLVLPRIIDRFVRLYPDVRVELTVTNAEADPVGQGFDLAIRAGALQDSSMIAVPFFELSANLWTTPDCLARLGKPLQPSDLARFPCVAYRRNNELEMVNGDASERIPMLSRVRCDDFETMKHLILLGGCVGWLPDFVAEADAARGLLVPALAQWRVRSGGLVHFVYPSQKYRSPNVQAFIEVAQGLVPAR